LGTITALSLSKLNNLVYSFDEKKIVDQFNLNDPPVQENGVLKLLKKHKKKTKILQVGLSYKKNTSTIRRSIPYSLFNGLKENIKNNAKIIDFEGSNKKSILSKNLSYISLENE